MISEREHLIPSGDKSKKLKLISQSDNFYFQEEKEVFGEVMP